MEDGQEQKPSLAFTFQKKKVVQKVAVNVEENKDIGQLISGIEGAKIQVVGGATGTEVKSYVIPKIENTYKSGVGPKKFTPSYKPPSSDANVDNSEDRFVQAASTVPVITEYGLQLRENRPQKRDQDAGPSNGGGGGTTAAAMEARAFREAVEELPEAIDVEAYESMPVEEFGKAMLRGMGWVDGMGVGRNRKKVDAIEYIRRPERLGLGAQPVALAPDPTKIVKMGDKPQRQDLVLAPDADGRQRNIRKLDEQLVARSSVLPGPQPGKTMRITTGQHAGLACTALEALSTGGEKPERWLVRLSASQEVVDVLASELGEKWERTRADSDKDARGSSGGGAGDIRGGAGLSERERERERGISRDGSREPDWGAGGSRREGHSGEPSSRRGEGRGADAARQDPGRHQHDRSYDRQYDRDRDSSRRLRGRERKEEGEKEEGEEGDGRSKRKYRVEERRPFEDDDDDDARGAKKVRGSEQDRRGDDWSDGQDDGQDNGRVLHRKHHKHDKKDDKKEKKSKKEKDHDGGGRYGNECDKKESYRGQARGVDDRGMEDERSGDPGGSRGSTWLLPYIKVRIVDKNVRSGKLYLKKGTVVDVHPGCTADVAVDDTGDVLRLPQSALETVVPRHEGAAVLVVAGLHRGARGRLLQASTGSGAAAVQLASDFSIVRLLLDDVAGFVGELEEE